MYRIFQLDELKKMYCFRTLAVGEEYCIHAKKLAEDIELNYPGIYFIVLPERYHKVIRISF